MKCNVNVRNANVQVRKHACLTSSSQSWGHVTYFFLCKFIMFIVYFFGVGQFIVCYIVPYLSVAQVTFIQYPFKITILRLSTLFGLVKDHSAWESILCINILHSWSSAFHYHEKFGLHDNHKERKEKKLQHNLFMLLCSHPYTFFHLL